MRLGFTRRRLPAAVFVVGLLLGVTLSATGCGSGAGLTRSASSAETQILASKEQRRVPADVPASDVAAVASGNTEFALRLFRSLAAAPSNLVLSPHIVSASLAIAYAGAKGATKEEIESAAAFALPEDRLHAGFNALDQELVSRYDGETAAGGEFVGVKTANSLWGQTGYTYVPAFLDTLSQYYGAELRLVDFRKDVESARRAINAWASEATEGKIPEVLPPDGLDSGCVLTFASAIYLHAFWDDPFEAGLTDSKPFHFLDGRVEDVPMMHQQKPSTLPYTEGEGWQAVQLPYEGGRLSCLLLLPGSGGFPAFVADLDGERLAGIVSDLTETQVVLSLVKFRLESDLDLKTPLVALGLTSAFDPGADFTGIMDGGGIWIDGIHQKAMVTVDENGTEAAAASAMTWVGGIATTEKPPVILTVDRPFVFLIRDRATGTVLFLGQVVEPRG